MATDTRQQFLDTAELLFAERGFYGVSIAAIADELGLTKQALLHHFSSKEKLYGEVLHRISERFEAIDQTPGASSGVPVEQFQSYLMRLQVIAQERPEQTRLLMRELLDNRRRADTAGTWYLKPFLERLITMVQTIPNWQSASAAEALVMIYQLLGAINYFGISGPTLSGIFGEATSEELQSGFDDQFARLIVAAIESR